MCAYISLAFAGRPDPHASRRNGGADWSPRRRRDRRPADQPDRLDWWLRSAPRLAGIAVLLAAVLVLPWPGPLLPLAIAGLALGLLLALGVAIALLLASRRPSC